MRYRCNYPEDALYHQERGHNAMALMELVEKEPEILGESV